MINEKTKQFENEYQKLKAYVGIGSFPEVRSQLAMCLCHLDKSNGDTLREQCHLLFEALWLNTDCANPQLLCEIFAPYMGRSRVQNADKLLLAHPDVIRSILLIGNAFDVNSIFLDRNSNPLLESFLLGLPGINTIAPDEGAFFEIMGLGLLNKHWCVLKSIYDFPLDDNWALRETLKNIPDRTFSLDNETSFKTMTLPENVGGL